jgi:hypothetical protein
VWDGRDYTVEFSDVLGVGTEVYPELGI